ncbi:protein ImuB [Chitinophaga sp. W3I9]|uniref:Y-family DNA polymerase n=1 Tax=unclassified Chitinophaga TaxID=2619133 RepID=UPI003D22F313
MARRFVSIWFPHLMTDWLIRCRPALQQEAFVLATPDHGRMIVTAASRAAQLQGITKGMAVADARALIGTLEVIDDKPGQSNRILNALGEWAIRFTPVTATDPPDGLLLEVTGCAHLWGSEELYLKDIVTKLTHIGYQVRAGMADTIGAAWAMPRFSQTLSVIPTGEQSAALMDMPPTALRLEPAICERLMKLGLREAGSFIGMPRTVLRRRFGQELLLRLDQFTGQEDEVIQPLLPVEPYQERLPCLEPIVTGTGIEIALRRLLEALCHRLSQEEKGLRNAVLKCYKVDGAIEQLEIGTGHPSHNINHLFKLFEAKIPTIKPDLGIELFVLEAPKVEEVRPLQETFWNAAGGLEDVGIAELIDRLEGKAGKGTVHRYLPAEHHWPEWSVKPVTSLIEKTATSWKTDRPRPIQLLSKPEPIEVAAPIPDYPPMHFRYKGKVHKVKKADGPERIESEWWLQQGQHRDYYVVEDDAGSRYWLFRLGHYTGDKPHAWFIHGFFA